MEWWCGKVFGRSPPRLVANRFSTSFLLIASRRKRKFLRKSGRAKTSRILILSGCARTEALLTFWSIVSHQGLNGKIVGASKVARDITDRITAEAKIRELNRDLEQKVNERTEELARTLLHTESSVRPITPTISTTAEGVVTTFNATAERW